MERYKVLPSLSSRLAEVETQYEEMREKNRQLEQKLVSMQVRAVTKQWFSFLLSHLVKLKITSNLNKVTRVCCPVQYFSLTHAFKFECLCFVNLRSNLNLDIFKAFGF